MAASTPVASARALDRLAAEEPCSGAVFTSYTFDPAFFEEHMLRAVLRLSSDPLEQAARYHGEARRGLQETPVVAIVDAGERRPGRRLPYDLLEVADRVFHPKSALLLYPEYARLLVGSGNLTFAGYSGQSELFLTLDLAYAEPDGAAMLRAYDAHLARVGAIARRPGSQLALVRAALRRKLEDAGLANEPAPDVAAPLLSARLLDSLRAPIIEQIHALIPENAIIERIGMLAPFYERDDVSELDVTSVFGALARRMARDAVLDVGVGWDNVQVHPDAAECPLEDGLGRLWSWAYDDDKGQRVIEHLVPTKLGRKTMTYTDHRGANRRWPMDGARTAAEQRDLWMQPAPIAFAPHHAIEAARERFAQVALWLYPATRLVDGRPVHRPLHAKLMTIGYRRGSVRETLVLMGSANMSRRALLLRAGPGQGNVELGVAFRLAGIHGLHALVPELCHAPSSALQLQEREFPELGPNHGLAIDGAVHDPGARTLVVTWSDQAASLPPWRLTYDGDILAESYDAPTAALEVADFVLHPASAEVVLIVAQGEYPAAILVTDLAALPATATGTELGLNELLMLLSSRIGAERALEIANRRAMIMMDATAAAATDDELQAFFGEGFGPTDVFRAWWSVARELCEPALSVQAFRLRLEGAIGVGVAWAHMCRADDANDDTGDDEGQSAASDTPPPRRATLRKAEVWFYGAELLRSLADVAPALPETADSTAKHQVLQAFCARVRADLSRIRFRDDERSWVQTIRAFYREAFDREASDQEINP